MRQVGDKIREMVGHQITQGFFGNLRSLASTLHDRERHWRVLTIGQT